MGEITLGQYFVYSFVAVVVVGGIFLRTAASAQNVRLVVALAEA